MISRDRNSMKGSQLIGGKENAYSKYKMVLQNVINGNRASSRDSRAFRNITNMYPKLHEELGKRKLQRPRNDTKARNANSKSVIGYSHRIRQSNNTVVLIESQKKPIEDVPKGNPQECGEYTQEIVSYVRSIEGKHKIDPDYMKQQRDINISMRSILIDWLIDVSLRFKLLPETLFLAVNIIDRYLQKEQVSKATLQLVGVTATLIASKYEEIYPPEIKDFVYITDYAYNKEEILRMEQKMLSTLEFNFNIPSSNRFLQYFTKSIPSGKKSLFLSQYLLELSLVEYKMLQYQPSMIAASSLYTAKKLNNDAEKLDEMILEVTKYTKGNLGKCVKDMVEMLTTAPSSTLQAARRKFASVKYMEVGKVKVCKRN